MAKIAKILTAISAVVVIVKSVEGISCLKGIRNAYQTVECDLGITQCKVLKHGQTFSDVMDCSQDTQRRPVGCRTGNVQRTKICFCDGDSCNQRDIPDIADPEPEEISHGEPDKTGGNAANSNTISTATMLSTMIAMVLATILCK